MQEITHGSSVNQQETTIPLPATPECEAKVDLEDWFLPIAKEIAQIADRPEYAKVTALERRRAEAEETIASMQARVAEIRKSCASSVLDDSKAIQTAAQQIEDCERSITTARLALDSVAAVLPAAIEAREATTPEALRKLLQKRIDQVKEEQTALKESIRKTLRSDKQKLSNAQHRRTMFNSWLAKKPEDVVACAEHCAADKKRR